MKPNYKNWVPRGMIAGFAAGTAAALACLLVVVLSGIVAGVVRTVLIVVFALALAVCAGVLAWCVNAYRAFSYEGKRQLSRQIVEGVAAYVDLPEGGVGLDVGCGSGALAIACARRNPQGLMVGVDRWGREYASFNRELCQKNATAEGTANTEFRQGDALKLPFPDETFDAVTSNYVYHNIRGHNHQDLLRETLRALKPGGMFAIHDIMLPAMYGNMQEFAQSLRDAGYQRVELIDTSDGAFMSRAEARVLSLRGSTLLVGVK